MKNVIFRADANAELGFGHLTRCRAIATELKAQGAQCIMVGPSTEYQLEEDHKIFKEWQVAPIWTSEISDANFLVSIAKRYGCTKAVLDDYRINEEYQQVMLMSGIKWLQFDGRADKLLWANWILNANPTAKKEHYRKLLKSSSKQKLMLGPSYAILRPEFQKKVIKKIFDTNAIRIFVAFGGGDDRGAIIFTLTALYHLLPQATFVIMSGDNNPRNEAIMNWEKRLDNQRIELHINPLKVRDLMQGCDLAVLSGGTITFEAVSSGLPMIIMTIADNQLEQARGWQDIKVGFYVGAFENCREQMLQEAVTSLINNYRNISNLIHTFSLNTDGCANIVSNLLQNE